MDPCKRFRQTPRTKTLAVDLWITVRGWITRSDLLEAARITFGCEVMPQTILRRPAPQQPMTRVLSGWTGTSWAPPLQVSPILQQVQLIPGPRRYTALMLQ